MRLDAVKLKAPAKKYSNDDILEMVRQRSEPTYEGDLDFALAQIARLLRYSGANTRRLLSPGETPLELLKSAMTEALAEASCQPEAIELLIYTGVGRGFVEPGNSYFIARAMGMDRVQCFDILDACNSWSRAVQTVHSLMRTGAIRRAMIVNAEFNSQEDGIGIFALKNEAQLEWTLPTYTIGEGATATILSRDDDREWRFCFSARPDLSDLCTVPLPTYQGFCAPSDRIGRNGIFRFTSFGEKLFEAAKPELLNIIKQLNPDFARMRAIFPHAASARVAYDIAKVLGIKHLLWNVYADYGNLVSGSIPAAIATAVDAKRISRGDYLVGAVASAGMSFAAYSFSY